MTLEYREWRGKKSAEKGVCKGNVNACENVRLNILTGQDLCGSRRLLCIDRTSKTGGEQ
jgi:hypothetical protein